MLPATPSFERRAINRITFGARDVDVAYATKVGWAAWVSEQLDAPSGDDPAIAAHIASQKWPIKYPAGTQAGQTWPAVDDNRPLTYLAAAPSKIWATVKNSGFSVNFAERQRIYTEFSAANLMRNVHAKWQLREFMADFWFVHFNIGTEKNVFATAMLIPYDRDVIRPNVFGNFRVLLEGIATSSSMLLYLDNAFSSAGTPNENYARELLELHTLGGGAYLGTASPVLSPEQTGVNAPGFTDADIIQASRAFSGWTLDTGQAFGGVQLKGDGSFLYSPYQHNASAQKFMGVDLSGLTADMAQGRAILDIVAAHPATATFICTKLSRRIFGDNPPAQVIERARNAWLANLQAPDQIRKVLEAILLDGDEIGVAAPVKLRRPYERLAALLRTTDMTMNACTYLNLLLSPVNDMLGAWQPPNGRPDVNSYWISTGPMLTAVNLAFRTTFWEEVNANLSDQVPDDALNSTAAMVDYWIGRMIGFQPDEVTYTALLKAGETLGLGFGDRGPWLESNVRTLVATIATTAAFGFR